MNKQRFVKILQDYDNIPDEDRNKLHDLAKNYPYSQIIHTLVAKANHDAQTDIAGQTLNYAAMYATDRAVLKNVIQHTAAIRRKATAAIPATSPKTEEKKPVPAAIQTPDIVQEKQSVPAPRQEQAAPRSPSEPVVKKKITINPELLHEASDDLRNRVWLDLEALKKSKASYMEWLSDEGSPEEATLSENAGLIKPGDPVKEERPETVQKAASPPKKKEKKQKKAKAEATEKKKPVAKKKEKKATKSKPKKAAQEEQNDLIEKFINKEPSITAKPLKSSENQPDLSEASTSFNEDLVSENLAQIFLSQGKKDKAIDIYKKLIWKFPQKKAYFASRIEELQK